MGCPPPELTRVAAAAGYDYVSFRTIFLGLPNEPNYSLAHNPRMLRETRAALAETGLKPFDIELARIADGVDVKSYRPALENAAELGIRNVISSIWTTNREFALDSLAELCDLAARAGLTVNLEFVTWASVKNLRDTVAAIRAVGRPNCGLMVDTLHFNRSRVELEELDQVPREWFHMVHLCDAPAEIPNTTADLIFTGREARLDPGCGGIDLAAIINRIPQVPYSLEIPNLERVKAVGYAEHARLCCANARAYLAAHPRPDRLEARTAQDDSFSKT
jgi:sugar phosphate isomerase/epimerase